MGRPAIFEPAPVRSPLRLAESYNPSIGLAGRSSRVAPHGSVIPIRRSCWQAAPHAGFNGKTVWPRGRCCEMTAVLCLRNLAGYHRVSTFTVQLSIQPSARGEWAAVPYRNRNETARPLPSDIGKNVIL